jgi:hypothetical protein
MTVAFDFHTLSLTIDHSQSEYQQATASGLGLNIWETVSGDRSKVLRFRHEHAHFTSFMASGLADLYGVISDYLLVFLYQVLRQQTENSSTLELPLINDFGSSDAAGRWGVVKRAWRQINFISALLFGFGTRLDLGELLDSDPQVAFWSIYFEERFTPIVNRYYRLMSRLTPNIASGLDLRQYRALPAAVLKTRERDITARAVMEAYAITLEIMNTYLRKVETSLTFYGSPIVRNPGPLYTVAIEYALEQAGLKQKVSLEDFMSGKAPPDFYYLVTTLSFAAMQVPVIQNFEGEVAFGGNLNTLCPAYRFYMLVNALSANQIPPFPPNILNVDKNNALLSWLRSCHEAIGDSATMSICKKVHGAFGVDTRLSGMTAESQSLIELSWAARANFYQEPGEYVLDAGLFAETYPCQPRYIRTNDGKLAMIGDMKRFQTRYIAEHAVPILEAAVFGEQWDSTWAKMPEIAPKERSGMITSALVYAGLLFRYIDPQSDPQLPEISLRI